jgi:hypothetical protein
MCTVKTNSMLAKVLTSFKSLDSAAVFPKSLSNEMVSFFDDNGLGDYLNGYYCLNTKGRNLLNFQKRFQEIYYGADADGDLQLPDLQLPETQLLVKLGICKKYKFAMKDSNVSCDWVKLI